MCQSCGKCDQEHSTNLDDSVDIIIDSIFI